jgi:hypothetical protein
VLRGCVVWCARALARLATGSLSLSLSLSVTMTRTTKKKKNGEYVYYNWLKPYDWLRGTITKKAGKSPNTVRVTFDKCPSCPNEWTATVLLEPAQYGERKRWIIAAPA